MMKSFRDLFVYTDRERNGLIVVISLVVLTAIGIQLLDNWVHPETPDFSSYTAELEKLQQSNTTQTSTDTLPKNPETESDAIVLHSILTTHERFFFNPNNLPETDWMRLGLSPKQARSVKKFEAGGGHFYKKEDLKKLYVISSEFYAQIEEYIVIPEDLKNNNSTENNFTPPKPRKQEKIELNTADSTALVEVRGIGPAFAKRIVAYRAKLGGFTSKEQLLEVFGFDQERFELVRDAFTLDVSYVQKININLAGTADFKKHPYITPGVANALVNYRKVHGPFPTVESIQGCLLVNADLYRKLAGYLTI